MIDALDRRGVIDIGPRLELLLDDDLIASTSRDAALLLHRPVPQEVVLETGAPDELSIYVSEGNWRGQGVSLRR